MRAGNSLGTAPAHILSTPCCNIPEADPESSEEKVRKRRDCNGQTSARDLADDALSVTLDFQTKSSVLMCGMQVHISVFYPTVSGIWIETEAKSLLIYDPISFIAR